MNDMAPIPAEDELATSQPQRRIGRLALMLSVPIILIAVGIYYYIISGRTVSTDNATIDAPVTNIAPQVSGQIIEVAVAENQIVQPGDLLFRIDPAPYRIALLQAEAAIANAKVQVAQLTSSAGAKAADVGAKGAVIGARNGDVALARENFRRQSALLARGFTTRAAYDASRAALNAAVQAQAAAVADRASAEASAAAAKAAIGTAASGVQPAIASAQAQREKALLDLSRTEVRAPLGGRITQSDRLQVGNMATQALPIVTIVSGSHYWVDANFKETQLAKIRVGQPAEVEIDAIPGHKFKARVASIGAGTGSEFSLLPAQNATGNWVKVTQRVPVRLEFIDKPSGNLVAGWSAKVIVKVAD